MFVLFVYSGDDCFDSLKEVLLQASGKDDLKDLLDEKVSEALFDVRPESSGGIVLQEETVVEDLVSVKLQSTPFFFLSLFVEYSRVFNIPMGIPINHRYVDLGEIHITNENTNVSLVELLTSNTSATLLDSSMVAFFYEIVQLTDDNEGLFSDAVENFPITALAQCNYIYEEKGRHGNLEFSKAGYCMPTESTYVSVMHLFKHTAKKFKFTFHRATGDQSKTFFDWRALFESPDLPNGSSYENLKRFVVKYDLPMDIDKYSDETLLVAHNELRHVIQSLVPFHIALLEGYHRLEAACRLFYIY